MAEYKIKDAKTANLEEIYFDKNVGKMCYKNAYGIITELEIDPPTPGAAVNPTNHMMPYNNAGVFADSGITVAVGGGGLKNYEIATPSNASGLSFALYPSFGLYSFGDATSGAATAGAVFTNIGSMVMGCNISSPAFGVFNADGASGLIRMGNQASRSIGVDNANGSMYIGSYFSLFGTPTNPATPAKWITVSDESSNIYYLPLYQ